MQSKSIAEASTKSARLGISECLCFAFDSVFELKTKTKKKRKSMT